MSKNGITFNGRQQHFSILIIVLNAVVVTFSTIPIDCKPTIQAPECRCSIADIQNGICVDDPNCIPAIKSENDFPNIDNHDLDPDHITTQANDLSTPMLRDGLVAESRQASLGQFDKDETLVVHRKVYLSSKDLKMEPIIHQIKLTIPVNIDDDQSMDLPQPKPMYKLKKYTVSELEPQTEMVPVTATVIKPAGVSKDQILNDGENNNVALPAKASNSNVAKRPAPGKPANAAVEADKGSSRMAAVELFDI